MIFATIDPNKHSQDDLTSSRRQLDYSIVVHMR